MSYRKKINCLIGAVCIFGVSACATFNESSEGLVQRNAQAQLDALMKGDIKEVRRYYTSESNAVLSDLKVGSRVAAARGWSQAKVHKVRCGQVAAQCEVQVSITTGSTIPMQKPGEVINVFIDQTWVLDQGKWLQFVR